MALPHRLLIVFTLITVAIIAAFLFLKPSEDAINQEPPMRSYAAMDIIKNPQPFCVGRMLIDLPPALHPAKLGSSIKISQSIDFERTFIETEIGVSLEEFKKRVATRWEEVKSYTHFPHSEEPYVKPSEYINARENGVVMAFNYSEMDTNARWENGKAVTDEIIVNDTEGYYWDQGTMFTLKPKAMVNINERTIKLINKIRYRALEEIPEQPGVCINGGFIEGFYQDSSEFLIFSVHVNKNLAFIFMSDSRSIEKSYIEIMREKGQLNKKKQQVKNKSTLITWEIHRAAERANDQLPSNEYVHSRTEASLYDDEPPTYDNSMRAIWEFLGEAEPHAKPTIQFDFVARTKTNKEPKNPGAYPMPSNDEKIPTEEEFMALWDSIVSTIRFRPNALAPAPVEPPKEPVRSPSVQQRGGDKQALDDFLGEG